MKTLTEACHKTGFQVHAYCLMPNHFHLVLETPHGNLVAGMRWLLSSYSLRLNHRRKLSGHVFSGRYKAHLVEPAKSYLKETTLTLREITQRLPSAASKALACVPQIQ